jgi:signal transduction histidine kinase
MITVTSSVGTSLDKTKRGMNSQLSSGSGTKERDDRENENLGADREKNEDDKEEEHEENIVGESAFHNSTATITSSTTSQTSSSGSRKSRRASLRSNKLAPCLFRTYDPMQVVTPEQLNAFSLLVSTPIWIFDFINKKNRYSNPAGLDLWSASSLDEFLNRSMSDMSAASVARTQECQNRVERAQVVQDMWTFYPKGKAKTVQLTMTAVRLSPDEDHCSIFVVGSMITPTSSINNINFSVRSSFSSIISYGHNNTNNIVGNLSNPTATANTTATVPPTATAIGTRTVSDTSRDSDLKQNPSNSTTSVKYKCTEEKIEETATANGYNVATSEEEVKDESKRGAEGEEKEKDEDDTDSYRDENIPLDHILENSNHTSRHHQMSAMDDDNPLNQEILRGVEIIRHLPIAVCQFDMKGRVMFQNPAAILPPLDEEEKEIEDDESYMDDMDTDDESSEYYEELFDQQYGAVQTTSSNNGRGNFLDRFVNKKVARKLLESLQDEPKEDRSNSITSTSSSVRAACSALANTTTVSIEAELHTSTKGRTQWSAIQLRKTKDPVTSRPVILYSAQDKSDAMEAKREREARLQKSEFLAIMAHEIRTPLHQVTGFIDLLELDACSNPITAVSSSGAITTATKNKTFTDNDSSIQNALFPSLDDTGVSSTDRPNTVKKSRSTSLINTRSSRWPSLGLPRQAIGNLTCEQRGYIKLLKSSANQLMTVISDVLDYSKLEAGKMKTERIPFELLSVVQGSMEAVRGSCEEKGLTLTLEYGGSDDDEYDYEDDEGDNECSGVDGIKDRRNPIRRRRSFDGKRSPSKRNVDRTYSFSNKNKKKCDSHPNIKSNDIPFRILGDPNRLRQVLLNLLSNAVKFTEKGGIHVRVSSFTKKNSSSATTTAATDEEPKKRVSHRASMSSSTSTVERKEERRNVICRSSMSSSTSVERKEEGRRVSHQLSMPTSTSPVERKDEGNMVIMGDGIDAPKSGTSNSSCTTRAPEDKASLRSIRIVVTDTGMGISKEQQNTIFEKYQQANLSVARNFGGTGLGLSICKLLVEETMGGSIGVDSDEKQGSSFYVTLPIEVPRETNEDTSRGVNGDEENQKNGVSMNILVAEDNKINQKLVANMLKRMGHKSTLVENGRQAIDMIEKQHSEQDSSRYDAVLMDIQMPVMDGLEATRRLRTMGYTDLPILGLTASVKRSDYEELGFTDWLPKPILMKDLKAKLLKLCTDHSEDSDESIVK